MKATLLELTGNKDAALTLLDDAVGIFIQDNPHPPEAPLDLLNQRSVLALPSQSGVKITTASAVNGELRFEWTGQNGVTYRVESSADFRTWQPEATGLSSTTGTLSWNGIAGLGSRFFRVAVE